MLVAYKLVVPVGKNGELVEFLMRVDKKLKPKVKISKSTADKLRGILIGVANSFFEENNGKTSDA